MKHTARKGQFPKQQVVNKDLLALDSQLLQMIGQAQLSVALRINKISVIVISYNTREMTIACLESVFEQTHGIPFELIVWDNASQDESAAAIGERFRDRIRLVASDCNLGFAVANNRAAELASGDYLLLLNPDTVVLDGAIDKLVEFAAARPIAGIWGGRTVFPDGTLNPASCWQRQTIWSLFCQASGLSSMFRRSTLFNPEGLGGWNRIGERPVDIVTGCFLLIRRDMWLALDGFREEFFMYGEEADLCLRARKLGAKPIVSSAATIIHYGGASEKVRADKMVRLLKAKRLLIYFHFTELTRRIGGQLLFLWPVTRYLAHSVLAAFGKTSSIDKRNVWREIVRRRREWFDLEAQKRITG
jgi:N-acetylglucosaminyl-diphospho-decaprenol L-rhamnosyltransferase